MAIYKKTQFITWRCCNLLALHSNNIYYTGVLIKSLTAAYYTVHTKHITSVLCLWQGFLWYIAEWPFNIIKMLCPAIIGHINIHTYLDFVGSSLFKYVKPLKKNRSVYKIIYIYQALTLWVQIWRVKIYVVSTICYSIKFYLLLFYIFSWFFLVQDKSSWIKKILH